MRTFGVLSFVALTLFGLYALMMFGVSFAGFGGEWSMILAAVLSLLMWGTFIGFTVPGLIVALALARGELGKRDACIAWTARLLLAVALGSVAAGLPLAFATFASCGPLFLSNLYHWGGLVASALGFVLWLVLPWVVRACMGELGERSEARSLWSWCLSGSAYVVWGIAWLVAWILLADSIDETAYPASQFRLPFPGGESSWVIQGNNTSFNHNGNEEHAWDFRRPCGSPVLAARSGQVTRVVDSNSGHDDNNFIEVTHSDNSIARYLHIQQDSAVVSTGTPTSPVNVAQGDTLASVGNVGNSLTGHIHFVVVGPSRISIPVTFSEVAEDAGIPRTFSSYTSGQR